MPRQAGPDGSAVRRHPEAAAAIAAFLRCGDLHAGFTRLQCPDCGHEFLLAFTCKQRALCSACHQWRTLTEGAFIADIVCAPIPHRHIVLTVPRLIRTLFRTNRDLLDDLYHAAQSALTAWLRQRTGQPEGQPGLVVAVQAFGDCLACAGFASNEVQLLLASFAQLLLERVRVIGLEGTGLAEATAGTIRVQLLKIAAQVTVSVRRVHVRLASAFARQEAFAQAHALLLAWTEPG